MRQFLYLALLFSSASPATAQSKTDCGLCPARFDSIRSYVRRTMVEVGLPSVSVAVAHEGRIIWEEAFGYADLEQRIGATPHTMYSLASISKPITATALMTQVERGQVNLDQPANEYLGRGKLTGLGGDAGGATVRTVANHTAGLPLHYQFYYTTDPYGVPTMDETITRYAVVMNPPGAVIQYSNLGFGILDYIVERTAGVPYGDYMRSAVFLPLGLTRTSVGVPAELRPFAAVRYDPQMKTIPFYDFDHRGASAVYSSAHDLVRFGMFHLKNRLPEQKRILKDETIDAMKVVTSPSTNGNGFGVSWNVIKDDFGLTRVSHTGGMPGVSTVLNLYPDPNIVVVAMSNAGNVGGILQRISADVVGNLVPRYAAARRAGTPPGPPAAPAPFVATPELTGEWTGFLHTYNAKLPVTMTFQPDGDIHVRLGTQMIALANQVSFRDGNLVARFAGTIPSEDVNRHRHNVLLNLWLRAGKLSGQASAQTTQDPVHFALTSYVELQKK